MRRASIAAIALVVLATGCFGGGPQTRTVLVDHEHDEFASFFLSYFPNRIQAHPGDTVVFRQTWTGEPHSVTMGKIVDSYGQLLKPYLKIFAKKGYEGLPDEPPKKIEKVEKNLVWMTDDEGDVQQNGGQPCYLKKGLPPKKASQPCTDAQQRQPEFDGTYNFYNSGFIPYQGSGSNTFAVKIAENAKAGEHFFYCNYHGPFMSGFLDIKPTDAKIPSQAEVSRQAQREINTVATPLLREFRRTQAGNTLVPKEKSAPYERLGLLKRRGKTVELKAWLAGNGAEGIDNALIDEFVPKRARVKVGQKLTWIVIGGHTISFNVPRYFPIVRVAKSGRVSFNPKIFPAAGGAPDPPGFDEEGGDGPPVLDARRWDGKGFWSTGFLAGFDQPIAYSLRITKPGTYRYACLVHPPMVGTIVVTR